MSLNYKLVRRYSMPSDKTSVKKYYALAKSTGVTDLNHLCRMIQARSAVSSADVKSVLDNLNFVMDMELSAGRIVKMGELGSFRLSLSSEGAEEEGAFNKTLVRKARVLFAPGISLQNTTKTLAFTRVSSNNETGNEADDEDNGDVNSDL